MKMTKEVSGGFGPTYWWATVEIDPVGETVRVISHGPTGCMIDRYTESWLILESQGKALNHRAVVDLAFARKWRNRK